MNQLSIYGNSRQLPSIGRQVRGGLGGQSHPRISIRGNQFLLIDAEGIEWAAPTFNHPQTRVPMLLCVIVGGNPNKSKVYYPEPWGGVGEGVPPLCFSDNGYGPSSAAQEPQSDSCQTCRWSKWGSATSRITGKGIPACSDRKKLALMVIGDETGHTYELQVPPASLGSFATYLDKVLSMPLPGGARETDLFDVVTAISFSQGQTGILEFTNLCWTESVQIGSDGAPTLCFNANGFVSAPDGGWGLVQRVESVWQSGTIDVLCGLKDQPWKAGAGVAALPGRAGMPAPYEDQRGTPMQIPAQQVPHPSGAYAPPPEVRAQGPAQPRQMVNPTPPDQAGLPAAPPPPPQQGPPATRGHGGARPGSGRKRGGQVQQATGMAPPQPANVVQLPGSGAPAQATAPVQDSGIPPFLQRSRDSGNPPPVAAPAAGNGQAPDFGMQPSVAPPPGIDDVLGKAFGLKTE